MTWCLFRTKKLSNAVKKNGNVCTFITHNRKCILCLTEIRYDYHSSLMKGYSHAWMLYKSCIPSNGNFSAILQFRTILVHTIRRWPTFAKGKLCSTLVNTKLCTLAVCSFSIDFFSTMNWEISTLDLATSKYLVLCDRSFLFH